MNLKVRFDFRSIKFNLWLYFVGFAIFVVALIWALEIFLLGNSYETMKIKEVDQVATSIVRAYQQNDENLTSSIQALSISNDYYVMMEGNGNYLYFSPESDSTMPAYSYINQAPKLKSLLELGGNTSVYFKINTDVDKYSTLAYGCILDATRGSEVYLYIFSPLYPVTSTINILKTLLMRVTFACLILAFILAIYMASRISKPLKHMTSTAKEMGKGNYNIKFPTDSYSEIGKLGNTLIAAAYEMRMADHRQKDLVANVSHDLKTPLTMIRSYAEMIRDLSGDNPEKRNAHLKVIIDESIRMSQLVSDMATVTAMQTRTMTLEKTVFDMTEVAASILASYEIYQERNGYTLTLNAQKECYVYADMARVKQIVANLTSNAIKYCGSAQVVIVNVRKSGRTVRFEVIDHGPGIAPKELPHVWDRYYKTSSNYVRPTEGSGLGLSIVKEILTLHQANYGVESKLGKGSTFWFELDLVKKDKERSLKDKSKEIPQDPASIEDIK